MPLVFNSVSPEVRTVVDVCGVESIVVPKCTRLETITYKDHKTIECVLYGANELTYLDIIVISPEEPLVDLTVDDKLSATVYVEKSLPHRWRIGATVDRRDFASVYIRIEFPSRIKLVIVDEEFYEMISGEFVKQREIASKN